MNGTVTAALVAAVTTAAGWLVAHLLQMWREDGKRRVEAKAAYVERQIHELYGPLFSLTMQIVVTNHVKYGLIENLKRTGAMNDIGKIEELFAREYFLPLHNEVREILKSRLHLVEGNRLPDAFYEYLRSATQERVQQTLWWQYSISTDMVKGRPYPDEFTFQVQETFESLLAKYDQLLAGLHPR